MSCIVINSGVQPESIQIGLAAFEGYRLSAYVTSSSLGYDHALVLLLNRKARFRKLSEILNRRVIKLPEKVIIRKFFVLTLISRLFPHSIFAEKINRLTDFLLKLSISQQIPDLNPSMIFCQSQPGNPLISAALKINSKLVLVLSSCSPKYFNEVRNRELQCNPDWFKYFPRRKYTQSYISRFEEQLQSCNLILVPSPHVAKSIQSYNCHLNINVVPLGFDPSLFHKRIQIDYFSNCQRIDNDSPFRVIFIGQIHQRKGIGYLVRGFQNANLPRGSTLTLVGSPIKGIKKFLTRYSFIEWVSHRSRAHLQELLGQSDLYLSASLTEGFSLAAIEAMSTGIPVAATSETLGDLISDKYSGFLIDAYSSEAISALLIRC